MTNYNGLLSTLNGGLYMDRWLENWIDELVDEYERLETEKLEKMAKLEMKSKPTLFQRLFGTKSKVEA